MATEYTEKILEGDMHYFIECDSWSRLYFFEDEWEFKLYEDGMSVYESLEAARKVVSKILARDKLPEDMEAGDTIEIRKLSTVAIYNTTTK